MNTTSAGLTGLATMGSQTGSIGTVLGVLMLSVVIGLAMYLSHEFNRKNSWLQKILNWLNKVGAFKAVIGAWTCGVVACVYWASSWLGSAEGSGFILQMVTGVLMCALGFIGLVLVGYASEPVWRFAWNYATNRKEAKA